MARLTCHGEEQGNVVGRSVSPPPSRPVGRLSGFRISRGVLWAVIAVICGAGGVGELTIGNAGGAIVT